MGGPFKRSKNFQGDINYLSAEVSGKMQWKNAWEPAEYDENDVVRDGAWTMVANKTTSDRPSPQPFGEPISYFGNDDPGFSVLTQLSASQIVVGQRYSADENTQGWIQKLRIFCPVADPNVEYEIYTVANPTTNPITNFVAQISVDEIGWNIVSLGETVVTPGAAFDVIVGISNESQGSTSFNGNWDYKRTNGTPIGTAGEIWHQSNNRTMNISNEDDSTDRRTELLTLGPGDEITAGGLTWVITEILDTPSWGISLDVTPQTRISNDAYGIDIEFQAAEVSDDWDLLASSETAIGAGTTNHAGLINLEWSNAGHIIDTDQ